MENTRQVVSAFKGLAPLSFPVAWTEGFDFDHGFAAEGGEGFIRFSAHGVFGVRLVQHEAGTEVVVRRLTPREAAAIWGWGPLCSPFEPYRCAATFGMGKPTPLDEVP